jgi:hypothetical protein
LNTSYVKWKKQYGNPSKMALPIFWGNHKAENYRDMVVDLVKSYKNTGCSMSLKVLFLDCHLDFPENLSTDSDFTRTFPPYTRGTKASGVPVCSLIILGHLEETFQRQNHPLLLFT